MRARGLGARELSRQQFLGKSSAKILAHRHIGIIGLGGGGSHIAQQLAHAGIGKLTVVDPDTIQSPNLNRTVGAEFRDIRARALKVSVAKRLIKRINPGAEVTALPSRWGAVNLELRSCDALIGCVDTYKERAELESFARRFMIPYLDIGMDVYKEGEHFRISGQVISSVPAQPCMRCLGFLTDSKLGEEAARYGNVGSRPQVVWANGTLASIATGVLVSWLSPWYRPNQKTVFVEYDGNTNSAWPSNRLIHLSEIACAHFTHPTEIGDPLWKPI